MKKRTFIISLFAVLFAVSPVAVAGCDPVKNSVDFCLKQSGVKVPDVKKPVKKVLKGGKEFYKKTLDSKKIAWMDKGMDAVKSKLKDGDSAKFRNVYFIRGTKGIPVSCGEVNSKNSFGAYSGFQRFVSGGDVRLTFLEEEVSDDFGNAWKTLCL